MSHECQILRSSGSLLNVFVSSLYFMIQRLKLLLLESARPDIDRLSLNLFLCCFRLPAACLRNIFVPRSLRVEGTFLLYFKRRTVIDSCKVCLFFVNDIYLFFPRLLLPTRKYRRVFLWTPVLRAACRGYISTRLFRQEEEAQWKHRVNPDCCGGYNEFPVLARFAAP